MEKRTKILLIITGLVVVVGAVVLVRNHCQKKSGNKQKDDRKIVITRR